MKSSKRKAIHNHKEFSKGDKVTLCLEGLQAFNRRRSLTRESNSYSRKLGEIMEKKEIGLIKRNSPYGMNVEFNGVTYDVKSYMVERAE